MSTPIRFSLPRLPLPGLRPIRVGLSAAALLALCASSVLASDAEIVSLVGKGEAKETTRADWRPAALRQKLAGGAFVRTGDLSQMALLMQDQTQLRLNQNSMLQIKEVATGSEPTRLDLKAGRAWMRSKGQAANVVIDTPNATAAIRGTEWELDVDPAGSKTMLAVFSGSVQLSNPQGSVSVGMNEAAVAELGKAPVKIVLTNPRDRVQWVNAFTIDAHRYAGTAELRPALAAIGSGDLARAQSLLLAERERRTRVPAVFALLADIELVVGDVRRATAYVEEGLAISPRDPELLAQLVRAQLLADEIEAARKTLERPREAETAAILVAEGETARREGLAVPALEAFGRATRASPADDRGWFALGRAQGEREDVTPARRNLSKALELNPAGAGYQGELGTIETFANRFARAGKSFSAALEANPADYVALTGLGLLWLKQGDPAAALEAFLKAGVLEPRYARAKTFTAVAYYQLGRHADAIATFREASALDDKDPLPYLFLTQVFTDLFRAGEAVDASREALKRLPYLKSLNQVANNQQGTGNFGYSLAFFGLEDWALELAQRSYNPHTASSHLFLADRYAGQYNRNSELFQGFLTDPTAFGSANRFSSLTPRAGSYGTLGDTYTRADDRLSNPYLRLNGLADWPGRSAYFLDAERGTGTLVVQTTAPDATVTEVKGDRRAELFALGLGSELTEKIAVFGFGTRFRDNVGLRDFNGTIGSFDKDRIDAGVRYRHSPWAMTWVKFGRTNEDTLFDNYTVFSADFSSAAASSAKFRNRPSDLEARHTLDLSPADRLSFGVESASDKRTSTLQQVGVFITPGSSVGFGFQVDQESELKSRQAYLSYARQVAPDFTAQGDLFWQRFEQRIDENRLTLLVIEDESFPVFESFGGRATKSEWNPRIGFAYTPGRLGVRAAWQRWTQPLSTSTLAPVATAGVPVDDRLVAAGGKATRSALQLHAELGDSTRLGAFYDNEKVQNLGRLGYRIPVPQIQFVELLRNAQLVNVNTQPLLEGVPDFDSGRAESAGLSLNHMINGQFSVAARFVHTRNRATIFMRNDAGEIVSENGDARIPFLPRSLGALGFTWVSPWRFYVSAQAVYRSERFTDRDNTPEARLRADTTGTIAVFWETRDKRLILGAGAGNLGSKALPETYVVDARYRF